MLKKTLAVLLLGGLIPSAHSLQNDTEQPATLYADEFEMDFSAGIRVYRGNVEFVQGSLRLNCDELTTHMGENDEIDKAICLGSPGRYEQLPEGHADEVVGTAAKITMDQVEQVVTLDSQAKIVQGEMTMTGKTITYDMVTEKASVGGGGSPGRRGTANPAGGIPDQSSRPGIVIQPRKKKTEPGEGEMPVGSTE